MKTRKNILVISLSVSIVCLISVFFFPKDSKVYEIMMAFMGSAFIAFLLEIPNYLNLRSESFSSLYWSLFNLKSQLTIFNNIINESLEKNYLISEKFYDQYLIQINNTKLGLQVFDSNYFESKTKRENCILIINDLTSKIGILSTRTINFSVSYCQKKSELVQNNQISVFSDIPANIMKKELDDLSSLCLTYIESLDNEIKKIFTKKQLDKWDLKSETLKNMTENLKNNK